MPRPRTIGGNKFVKFRVSEKFYTLIKELAERSGLTISETCRSALEIFFMGLVTGKFKHIEEEFNRLLKEKRNYKN